MSFLVSILAYLCVQLWLIIYFIRTTQNKFSPVWLIQFALAAFRLTVTLNRSCLCAF